MTWALKLLLKLPAAGRRHGIVTAGRAPGMTAAQATQGQPSAAEGTVGAQRFDRVDAARGAESTVSAEERPENDLVAANARDQESGGERGGSTAGRGV